MKSMDNLNVVVGDDRDEVCIRRTGEETVLLAIGSHFIRDVPIGLLRSLHQAVGAFLALTKKEKPLTQKARQGQKQRIVIIIPQ